MQQKIIEEQIINIEKIKNHYYNKNNGHTYECYVKSFYPVVYIVDEYQRFTLQSYELSGEKLRKILEKESVSEYAYVRIVYAVTNEYLYCERKCTSILFIGTDMINYNDKDYRYYLYFNLSDLESEKVKISEILDFVENRFYLKKIDSITLDHEKRICFIPKDNNWEQLYTLYQLMNLIK